MHSINLAFEKKYKEEMGGGEADLKIGQYAHQSYLGIFNNSLTDSKSCIEHEGLVSRQVQVDNLIRARTLEFHS